MGSNNAKNLYREYATKHHPYSKFENEIKKYNDKDLSMIQRDADAVFSIIDANGDGFISRRELTNHLTDAGYTYAVVNSIFNKLDINNDGKISKKEFRNGYVLFTSLRSAKGLGNYQSKFENKIHDDADTVFNSVDINQNGEIDIIELKSHLNNKFSKKAITKIFDILDINNDGTISRQELRDAFVRYSALRLSIGRKNEF